VFEYVGTPIINGVSITSPNNSATVVSPASTPGDDALRTSIDTKKIDDVVLTLAFTGDSNDVSSLHSYFQFSAFNISLYPTYSTPQKKRNDILHIHPQNKKVKKTKISLSWLYLLLQRRRW